jgi:hypothetical protein
MGGVWLLRCEVEARSSDEQGGQSGDSGNT